MIHKRLITSLFLFTLLIVELIGQGNRKSLIENDKVYISTGLNASVSNIGAGIQYPTQYSFLAKQPDSIKQILGIGGGIGLHYGIVLKKNVDLMIGVGAALKNLNYSLFGDSLSPFGNPEILCNRLNHRYINIYLPLSVNFSLRFIYIGLGLNILIDENYFLRYYFNNLKVSGVNGNSYIPNTFLPTINPTFSISYQFNRSKNLPLFLIELKYDYMKGFGNNINLNAYFRIN